MSQEQVWDISVIIKETGVTIHASESQWCRIRTVKAGSEWIYGFEEAKGQPNPDYDYNEPVLSIEKRDDSLQLTVAQYDGRFHVDVFAFGKPIFRNVGGTEKRLVGASRIVEIPTAAPKPPAPPAPPAPAAPPTIEVAPITERLDRVEAQLEKIEDKLQKLSVKYKANTYTLITIDLTQARTTFEERTATGFALTIFSNNGYFDLKIGEKAQDAFTIEPLTYPEMITITDIEFSKLFIRNAAQAAGTRAIIAVWRRE